MKHIRPILVATGIAIAMLVTVHEAARPGQAQQTDKSQISSITMTENAAPAWVQTFKDGQDGVFDAASGTIVPINTTSSTGSTTLQAGGKMYFVGVVKKEPWRLDRCDGQLLGNVFMTATLATEVETVYNEGYRHQVLLGRLGDNGFDINIDSLEDVRAGARNGYCGNPPPPRHFDEGTLEQEANQSRTDVFGLFPWLSMRNRPLPVDLYVDRLANLFAAHRGYRTSVQGEYKAGDAISRGAMWALDRVVFEQPGCCGKKISTVYLPHLIQTQDWRRIKYFPWLGKAPAAPDPLGGPTATPGGPATPTTIPNIPTPIPPTPTPIAANSSDPDDPRYTGLDTETLTKAAEWTSVQQLAGAPLVAQLVGYNGGLSTCGLKAVGTDDGGGVINDPSQLALEGQWGDRLYGITPSGFVRLSYPADVSPGRPAFRPCSMAAATNSNNLYDVVLVIQTGETYRIWFGDNSLRQVLMNGAIVAGERQGNVYVFWVATGGRGWPWLVAGDIFGLSKIRIDVTDRVRPIVTEEAHFPALSPIYNAGLSQTGKLIYAIESEGTLHVLDLDLNELVAIHQIPQLLRPEAFEARLQVYRGVLHHMSLAQDDRHIVMGSGRSDKLIVIDLEAKTSWLADAPDVSEGFYIGVAFNPYEGTPLHQLAAHTGKSVLMLQPTADWKQFVLAGRPFVLPESALKWDSYLAGPQCSLAWTGPSDLAASWAQPRIGESVGHAFEFVNLRVDGLGTMSVTTYHDTDFDPHSYPNGLAQCNGPRCNEPPPPPTPTRTMTPTPPPTNTPTPTPTEPCIPRRMRADIVLVADVSSSMKDGTKLPDLKRGLEAFVSLMEAPNQVAIGWFDRTAGMDPTGLTTDKFHLYEVIDGLQTGSGTSIDQGLEKARLELQSSRHKPDHAKVLVLFSDGRHNGTGDVRAAAQALKDEGVNIFTIGLGDDADRGLLEEIATNKQFYFTPSSGELAKIYRQIAADIPCPTPIAP